MLRKRAGAHKKLRHGVEPEAPSEDFEGKPGCWSEPRARSGGPASASSKKASAAKGAKAVEGSAWPRRVLGHRGYKWDARGSLVEKQQWTGQGRSKGFSSCKATYG